MEYLFPGGSFDLRSSPPSSMPDDGSCTLKTYIREGDVAEISIEDDTSVTISEIASPVMGASVMPSIP